MRAPGILGWDRENELTDWREVSAQKQPLSTASTSSSSSSSSTSSSSTTQTTDSTSTSSSSSNNNNNWFSRLENRQYRSRHESRSTERHANYNKKHQTEQLLFVDDCGNNVFKTKPSLNVDAWAEEIRTARERRSNSSGRCTDHDTEAQSRSLTGSYYVLHF